MKLVDRININKILAKHFATLYDHGKFKTTGKKVMPISDWIVFLVLPVSIATLLYYIGIRITEGYINILMTSLSIFVGLLFSLLTLIFDLGKKEKEYKYEEGVNYKQEQKYILIKELFINTSFSIALSIVAILSLLSTQFDPTLLTSIWRNTAYYGNINKWYSIITTIISITLIVEFVLVLFMILKRFFLIFLDEFGD